MKLGFGVVSNGRGVVSRKCVSGGERTKKVRRLKEDQSRS